MHPENPTKHQPWGEGTGGRCGGRVGGGGRHGQGTAVERGTVHGNRIRIHKVRWCLTS